MHVLIQEILQKIVKSLTNEPISIQLEIPQDLAHGDYTTNIAFHVGRLLKISPREAAEKIIRAMNIERENISSLEKIEVAGPGFINFYLSQTYFMDYLQKILLDKKVTITNPEFSGKKIVVEFTDPNPFKELHIGHVYTNTVGEAISRLFEANGAIVWRADYFGDVGMHVAKAIYAIQQQSISLLDMETKSLSEKAKFLGKCYAEGSKAFEEDDTAKETIKKINRLVYIAAQQMWEKEKGLIAQVDYAQGQIIDEQELQQVYELYVTGRTWSLNYFDSIYERLGMHFDGYYPESIAGERGYALVKEHITDGVFEKNDGAIIFSKEKNNLHTRVFINSLGLPTYEAKELGLAPWKYEEFPYDDSYIITGNEIIEYFKVLVTALTSINPALGKKTHHIGHGMVRLPEGKMSSRTGNIITGEWLLNEAIKKAQEMKEQQSQSSTSDDIASFVGIGAIKYAFLKSSIGKDLEFDFETSLSLNGNSGPYLQYTYVRTQSILQKAETIHAPYEVGTITLSNEELTLLRVVHQFEQIVIKAAENLSPSTLCTYLYELAKQFNLFYQTYRIADAANQKEKEFRLNLTAGVGIVLAAGLSFLGIEAPKRM